MLSPFHTRQGLDWVQRRGALAQAHQDHPLPWGTGLVTGRLRTAPEHTVCRRQIGLERGLS
jgi:hypothetical protein